MKSEGQIRDELFKNARRTIQSFIELRKFEKNQLSYSLNSDENNIEEYPYGIKLKINIPKDIDEILEN